MKRTIPRAGRTTSSAPLALVSDPPGTGRRPSQLDDPEWLGRRLERDGAMAIALDLGVTRWAVRAACERLGIPAASPGRRRSLLMAGKPTVRFDHDYRVCPPSEALLAERIRAAQEAKTAGDKLAYEDAMLGVSAIAGRIVEHSRMLRRAA